MKRAIALIGLVFGMMLIAGQASAQGIAAANLDLVLSSQSPYPVEPGATVDVEVALQNSGLDNAQNVVLVIEPKEPFSLKEGETESKNFNLVGASSSVKASYQLHVSKTAVSGDYDLNFRYYTKGHSDVSFVKSISVTVQGTPKFVLRKVETEPSRIEPGESFQLKALIENVGTGGTYYLQAMANASSTYILPVLSGGMDYLGDLGPGEIKEAVFEMSVDSSAEYKTYSGTLSLSYRDDTNTMGSTDFTLGFPVIGIPVIEVLSTQIDNGDFKVDIENIGSGTAKALKTSFIQDNELKDVSVTNELKPSKHKTLRFAGYRYGQALINISYLDEINEFHVVETPVTIKQKTSAQEESGSGQYDALIPILAVIVVLETYYIWRVRKRTKAKK